MNELSYIKKLIRKAEQKNVKLKDYKADRNLTNYKLREKQYLVNSIKNEVKRIYSLTNNKKLLNADNLEELKQVITDIGAVQANNKPIQFSVDLNRVADTIKAEIKEDIREMKVCFENKLYRSAIILCGRILEVVLHRKYFECTGKDLLETSPGIGLGKMIAKLKAKNVNFPPGISQQVHLINHIRINSVHKKQRVFKPSRHQTQATILYTLDVIEQLY
ncbi:MAG: hypothetical protein MAG795_00385 [Candidatus Woesearchaeota archaeon]|nr:hypothetical protein [Candidatus Woesearchaeota archaeon]